MDREIGERVMDRFKLSENFINKYKRKKPPFGFNGLGELVYNRTYSRLKENGKNEVILADEISPDTCRLWDSITDKKLDKDRFRKNLGDLIPAYTEVAKRLGILHEQSNLSAVNVTKLRSIKKRK